MTLFAFLAQTLRIAIPYLFAASGGVISERSGLIGLGLEGYMLVGAFCGAVAGYYSGNPWVGLLGALAGGALLALLYALTAIRFRADQVVVGIAINLLVTGATRFFLRLFFHSSANSPRIPGFGTDSRSPPRSIFDRGTSATAKRRNSAISTSFISMVAKAPPGQARSPPENGR